MRQSRTLKIMQPSSSSILQRRWMHRLNLTIHRTYLLKYSLSLSVQLLRMETKKSRDSFLILSFSDLMHCESCLKNNFHSSCKNSLCFLFKEIKQFSPESAHSSFVDEVCSSITLTKNDLSFDLAMLEMKFEEFHRLGRIICIISMYSFCFNFFLKSLMLIFSTSISNAFSEYRVIIVIHFEIWCLRNPFGSFL